MSLIEKKNKLGEGAYGIVYAGAIKERDKEVNVAIKRNYGDREILGISCIREMNFLAFFSGHPCITKLKHISVGDPFEKSCPMTPRAKRDGMVEDSHHFVMEYAGESLEKYYVNCTDNFHFTIIMCQILLGIEYIHAKGVVHRDLKPANILVLHDEEDNLPYAKICDFGLSCFSSNYRPSTPGTVTAWYRAPEICCEYEDYSFPSDMWSIGCIFYEMFVKKPFIDCKIDSGKAIFKLIVSQTPEKLSVRELNEYINEGDCDNFKSGYNDKVKKKSFEGRLPNMDNKKQCAEIIEKLLIIDHTKRWTAKRCLSHPYFKELKTFISEMRSNYPPEKNKTRKLKIIDCIERRMAANIVIKLYNSREQIKWYTDHIIFHALRIFDEYLAKNYNPETNPRKEISRMGGQLLTEHQVELYFYTCIYMMYKYFSTLYRIYEWNKIFPRHLSINKNKKIIERIEKELLEQICENIVFRPTLIEYLDDDYFDKNNQEKDLDIRKYLINYIDIGCNYEGTMEDLYLQIREGLKSNP